MAIIISADEIKKTMPGYEPARSEEFHSASAKQADKDYGRAVKEGGEKCVVLMSGGTASGKTEYVSAYLESTDHIVLDGTLPSVYGANAKIRTATKADKRVEIHAVIPKDLEVAFAAFLGRERKFSAEHFFRTHSESRKTLLELAAQHTSLVIRIFTSEYIKRGNNTLRFEEIVFENRNKLIEYLKGNQYTENEIKAKVLP